MDRSAVMAYQTGLGISLTVIEVRSGRSETLVVEAFLRNCIG